MSLRKRLFSLSSLLLISHTALADETVEREIGRLLDRTSNIEVIELPATGSVLLDSAVSVTVDKLRNVTIDDNPPTIGTTPTYPTAMADGVPSGCEPYIAQNVAAFRFNHFHNEWRYAGWYTWEMEDYALAHGFQIGVGYTNRAPNSLPVANSDMLGVHGFGCGTVVQQHTCVPMVSPMRPSAGISCPRVPSSSSAAAVGENRFPAQTGVDYAVLDLEQAPRIRSPKQRFVRSPGIRPAASMPAFEDDYYNGYIDMTLAAAETAKTQGWSSVGIYGWAPFQRIWFGTENIGWIRRRSGQWNRLRQGRSTTARRST